MDGFVVAMGIVYAVLGIGLMPLRELGPLAFSLWCWCFPVHAASPYVWDFVVMVFEGIGNVVQFLLHQVKINLGAIVWILFLLVLLRGCSRLGSSF